MIYLLGGSGYVGQAYQKLLTSKRIAFKNLQRNDLDYTDVATLLEALRSDKPDFLINAAGYTGKPNVDACEVDKANCLFGNAILPGRIAEACEITNTPWGHVSSGCIYTGTRENGTEFTEADAPNFTFRQNNCSFYSGTKALGEEILKDAANVYLWRLRIPFNNIESPRNYLTKLIRYENLLEASNSISELNEFVAATFACWEKHIPFGTYNVTNPGYVTTREVVELIKASGVCSKEFKFFKNESDFMEKAAQTPRSNCIMSSAKLAAAGIQMTPVKEAIRHALSNWTSQS
jgi:dTDP-4-dehydrorhamnose reductase